MRWLTLLALFAISCAPVGKAGSGGPAATSQICAAGTRDFRDAVSRLSEELQRTNLRADRIGPSCTPIPADDAAATELIAANAKLPKLNNGAADSAVDANELQRKYPLEWTKFRADLADRILRKSDYVVDIRWCIRATNECFDTKAVVDAAGRVKFEPVLSMGVWRAQTSVQPREVNRHIRFFDGLGAVAAEFSVNLTYQSDSCTITRGTEAIDIHVVTLNNALFQDTRDVDSPTIYKGTEECGQPGSRQDWIRARATVELKTLANPSIPMTSFGIVGVTRAVTIRFDVSASRVDRTQVAN